MYICWKRKTTSQMPKVNVKWNESEAMASKDSVIRQPILMAEINTRVRTPNRGLKQPCAMTAILNAWQKKFCCCECSTD